MKASNIRRKRILVLVLILGVAAGLVPAPVEATTRVATTFDATHPLNAPKDVNGVEYQYDANGNLLDDGERTIEWNLENKPESITQLPNNSITQIIYDGDGRRIIKNVKTQNANLKTLEPKARRLDRTTQISKLVYVNNNLTIKQFNNETTHEYYYSLPPTTAVRDNTGVRYLHTDHLGSTRLVTNSEGQTLSAINYFPYGESVNESVSQRVNESRYLYTGQELDAESSLYNLNARLYNPTTGVFISPDEISDPSSRGNRYQYAVDSPLKYKDPSGRQPELDPGVVGKKRAEFIPFTNTPFSGVYFRQVKIGELTFYYHENREPRPTIGDFETISEAFASLPKAFQKILVKNSAIIYYPTLLEESGGEYGSFSAYNRMYFHNINTQTFIHEASHVFFHLQPKEFERFIQKAQTAGYSQTEPYQIEGYPWFTFNLTGPDISSYYYGIPYHLLDWNELAAVFFTQYILGDEVLDEFEELKPLSLYVKNRFFSGPGFDSGE